MSVTRPAMRKRTQRRRRAASNVSGEVVGRRVVLIRDNRFVGREREGRAAG